MESNLPPEMYDPTVAPRPHCPFVDSGLSKADEEAAKVVAMSLLPQLSRRTSAVFLMQERYHKTNHMLDETMAQLLLECLPAFLQTRGGKIVYGSRFDEKQGVVNPIYGNVATPTGNRQLLRSGSIFVTLPNERIIVSVDPCQYPGRDSCRFAVLLRACSDPEPFWVDWNTYARKNNFLRGQSFFADGEMIIRSRDYDWDDILIPSEMRQTLRTHIESFLKNREQLNRLGVKSRRGLILAGPPGTGKTLLGKILADSLDASFIWVAPRHIHDASSFSDILDLARFVSPTVLFLEDLDLFAQEREISGTSPVLGELMNQLDGAIDNEDLVAIATTNHLDSIEQALRNRPGRFDRLVEFGPMEPTCRARMLKKQLAKASLAKEDLTYLVDVSDGYTGAQIEELANTLLILAVEQQGCQAADRELADPVVNLTRDLIDQALADADFETKKKLGFHVT